ncbi:tubulin polyglutamylase ttll-5 isoform X1 [Hydra vulgaris]|uniref:tubulin polyglutamylase ttll-5 isoform X1 n=2 Tax=Hydra vulgaris TaxID=6087 RepID=UPI0032EA07CA
MEQQTSQVLPETGKKDTIIDNEKSSTIKIYQNADKSKEKYSILQWSSNRNKKPIINFSPACIFLGTPESEKEVIKNYHLKYKFIKTECKLVRNILSAHGFKEICSSNNFNLLWMGSYPKPNVLHGLTDYQKVNHFPCSNELTRKDKLCKNIQKMQYLKGYQHFNFIPKSFILPTELNEFYNEFMKDQGPWIIKPYASSRGRGIFLINNKNDIPLGDGVIACKYIKNPLLISGFKFDCRLYVAVTSYDPLRVYLFEEGLTRFSTVKYDMSEQNLQNQRMHLTNYSINKSSKKFVRCEDPEIDDYGSKWSFSGMLRFLKCQEVDTQALMARIEDLIIKTIISVEMVISTACRMFVPHRGNCFELYGFDILIDENLKPWLLEVNLSPSLACDSPLDMKIKSILMTDMFNLAGFLATNFTFKDSSDNQKDSSDNHNNQLHLTSHLTTELKYATNQLISNFDGSDTDECKLLHEANDEYKRRGGFVRIYPTPESWDLYGCLHEHQTNQTHNRIMHSQLFPELWHFAQRPYSSSCIASRRSSKISGKVFLNKLSASNQLLLFHHRYLQYERKLEAWCSFQNIDCEIKDPFSKIARYGSVNSGSSLNSLEVIKHGKSLSLLQARKAVAVYFEKICLRLQEEIKSPVEVKVDLKKQEKQINSIERFLHKAAGNFNKLIMDCVVHKNIIERKKSLINQLKRFLKLYLKETHSIKKLKGTTVSDNCFISEKTFETFLLASRECDLEELLVNYTLHNKATGLFCGAKSLKMKSNVLYKRNNGSNGYLHSSSNISELKKNEKSKSNTQSNTINDHVSSILYVENLTLKDDSKNLLCTQNDLVSSDKKSVPNLKNVGLNKYLLKSQDESKFKKDNKEVFNPGRKKLTKNTTLNIHRKRLPSADSLQRTSFQRLSYLEKQRLCNTICIYAGTNAIYKSHQDITTSFQSNRRNLFSPQFRAKCYSKSSNIFPNNDYHEEPPTINFERNGLDCEFNEKRK